MGYHLKEIQMPATLLEKIEGYLLALMLVVWGGLLLSIVLT